jgi:beta-galactosidase/beta-glucuronidase
MVRKEWQNLNGLWDLAIIDEPSSGVTAQPPAKFDTKILVPYPVESALSGVGKRAEHVWYRRSFEVPKDWNGRRIILNFEAVDWETRVLVNGKEVVHHTGGYDPFSADITDALTSGAQELLVGVWDPTDKGDQPRGKQVTTPKGIWYVPSTGIWQTVWMEPVQKRSIVRLGLQPDVDKHAVQLAAYVRGGGEMATLNWKVLEAGKEVATGTLKTGPAPDDARGGADNGTHVFKPTIVLPDDLKLWSPDSPTLYDLELTLEDNGAVDTVQSYFGMRKIEVKNDGKFQRIWLNGKPIFQVGPLDQGFWPDGLHTAPTDKALKWDLEEIKRCGFNMLRKHIKVEPARWYYWADKLGVLVWQDMPSGNNKTDESKKNFADELRRMIAARGNSPAIVMWVVFNEGWGEFDKEGVKEMCDLVKKLDPTRLVNNASGWTDMGWGDVDDMHKYPGPGCPKPDGKRAAVLGEFGGLGLQIKDHGWSPEHWGYQGTSDRDNLMNRFDQLMRQVFELRDTQGLCASVYTQWTDVETESNGVYTYDRAVAKMDIQRVHDANVGKLAEVETSVLVPTSEREPQTWRYTVTEPAKDWNTAGFDDSGWQQGQAGFGQGDPNWPIRTKWDTKEIWMRREVDIPEGISNDQIYMKVFHDEEVRVYLNGELAVRENGFQNDYQNLPIGDKARATIKPGKNILAVNCRNKEQAQFIDVGIISIRPKSK